MSHVSREPSSSPLSSVKSQSPEPPSPFDYPSPASEFPTEPTTPSKSRDASLSLDGASDDRAREGDGPPPAKRRKVTVPKPRTTENLDLNNYGSQREGHDQDNEDLQVRRLTKALRKKKKIVVIAGAGISVKAGIPDFRSSNGLFKQLKSKDKMKASGKDLFDAAVYRSDDSTESFHKMIQEMSKMTGRAKPTKFHHMLASLAKEGRLMRLYTQNVDGLETAMEPLATQIPLPSKGPWPVTIQLHGGLDKMVCTLCNELSPFQGELFEGPEAPTCKACEQMDDVRVTYGGKRSRGIGRLRPRIVLYNEGNPDDEAIGACSEADLKSRPDAVIVAGTSLKIPGLKRIVKEMCAVTRGRKDGFTAWINKGPDPIATEFKDSFDLLVQGDCEEVADVVNLPEWNATEADDPVDTYTAEDVEKLKKVAALRVVVNGTATSTKQNLKKGGILTPQSPRYQSPAPQKGAKGKQSKLAFDTQSTSSNIRATAKTTKVAPKTSKTTKTAPKSKTTEKAASKKAVGRPRKSTVPPPLKSVFSTTKRRNSITKTKKDHPDLHKNLGLDTDCLFPNLLKRKATEPTSLNHHDPMRTISPTDIRNNMDPSTYKEKLEIKDSEADSSFSSIDLGSEDELAVGSTAMEALNTGVAQTPPQLYQANMSGTVSPKGGLPRGMENLLH